MTARLGPELRQRVSASRRAAPAKRPVASRVEQTAAMPSRDDNRDALATALAAAIYEELRGIPASSVSARRGNDRSEDELP